MKTATQDRLNGSAAFVAFLLAVTMFFVGAMPVNASVCVDCHTNEEMLAKNLSGFVRPRSAMTSGAG